MKKYSSSKLVSIFNSKWMTIIMSVFAAFMIWLFVVISISPAIEKTINDIPISINSSSTLINPTEGINQTVSIKIYGKRFEIGGLTKDDFTVVADTSNVSGSGKYTLDLYVEQSGNVEYTLMSIYPETIDVSFERMLTKNLDVVPVLEGVDVPDGYLFNYSDDVLVSPSSVEIIGPEDVINQISSARVTHTFRKKLTTTFREDKIIEFLDANGNIVTSEFLNVSNKTAELDVQVRKIADIPLTVSFLNVPRDFPIDELQYSLSSDSLLVATDENIIKNVDEIVLGYINFKQLNLAQNRKMTLNVTLPSNYVNVDKVESVDVSFKDKNYTTTSLNIDNFIFTNIPFDYTATVLTDTLNNVTFVGTREDLKSLSSDDVLIEIDLSQQDIAEGQYKLDASIFAPTNGAVWAIGDYKVLVNVTKG